MLAPATPDDEAQRLQALKRYAVLDTESEAAFDDITGLAAQICGTPIALISLIDCDRQWFKSRIGIELEETPRSVSFCGHAILSDRLFVIEDARDDRRFSGNPLVTGGPRIRFYAGAPLATPDGHRIGTLCVIDHVPRQFDDEKRQGLLALARQAVALLELRRKSRLLERRDLRRSGLFSLVSHDLRTAFTGLLGHIGVLADDAAEMEDSDVQRHARRAREQARKALQMAEDLLAWSRAELGGLQFRPRSLLLADRIEHCVELLQPLAEDKSIPLEMQCPPELALFADETLLNSMLRNLIANAIKFSPAGEPVRIDVQVDAASVVISIQDRGAGISAEQIDALARGDMLETTPGTAGERGTGLGLLTTAQFAARHGGQLRFTVNQGTRAELHLPRRQPGTDDAD